MVTQQKVHIAFDDVGTGDRAVVLMHGLFEDRSYYAAQVQDLSRRHRVLNIDLRGHGQSDVPADGYSLEVLADDVARVCDDAGVTRAVLCGHSMAVALRVANRRPELAAGVVLLDGAILIRPEANEGLRHVVAALDTVRWREALIGFFTGVAGPAADRVKDDISAAPRAYAAPMLSDIVDQRASGEDARELAAVPCPLMYVHSQMPIDLERLREVQPDAIVEEIPGAGHYSMLTAPDQVNALIDRFLDIIG